MTEPDPFEAHLRATLDRHADDVVAPPGPVSTIVDRSHRRMVRRRAAGALAGAGSLLLAAGVVTRTGTDVELSTAVGPGSTSTSSPGGSTTSEPTGTSTAPSTTVPPPTTVPTPTTVPPPTTVPTTTSAGAPDDGLGPTPGLLVPDPASAGILSSTLRIAVDPPTGLQDRQAVTVRGSEFPPGAKIGLIMCSTDGLKATSLNQGAGWCDVATNVGFTSAGATVAGDGTFAAPFTVRRNLSTMGGAYDCALGTADPAEARALRDQGLLGPTSYPPGVWGCSVVAVVTGTEPYGDDGSTTVVYLDATAEMVTFQR